MSLNALRGRAAAAVLGSLLAAGCASSSSAGGAASASPAISDQPIVPGEALVRALSAPVPESLTQAADLPDLVVTAVQPIFGKVYLVRFSRASSELAVDEAFTRAAIDAFGKVEGILSSEPNVVEQPRVTPEAPPASENP